MINLQPTLENDFVYLRPLQKEDFEDLYAVASDPKIWEQHPNNNRWKREVFANFFEGALLSEGALVIFDKQTEEVIGCTRFYAYDEDESSIFIGYTFYARKYWGGKYNPAVKRLMLNYIFQYVDYVRFHVGKDNLRSRKAMEKLGAKYQGEIEIAYYGEPNRINVTYSKSKEDWLSQENQANT